MRITALLLSLTIITPAAAEADYLGRCDKAELLMPPGINPKPGRKYPRDRIIDIQHLKLDVTPDFSARTITGTATLAFRPIAEPLKSLELDAVELTVESVAASGAEIAEHQNTGEKLIVTFARPIAAGADSAVTVTYRCQPQNGLHFRTPEMGYKPGDTQLWTQGEAEFHRFWFPGYDYPNERFSSEIICHAPEGMDVISNGKLLSKTKEPSGLTAWHWRQEQPHVNYLVALACGRFHKLEGTAGALPLALYVPPSEKDQAPLAFRDTRRIIEFYQQELGTPFPWDKYDQVYCLDFLAGGMENTSCTFLAAARLFPTEVGELDTLHRLDAHETAHQWFGDLLTCRDWAHLWLNEGFASYYTVLYEELRNGRDSMIVSLRREAARVIKSADTRPIVWRDYAEPMQQFDNRAYPKGAWVLHMLRSQLGPDLYRKSIREYIARHRNGIVTTDDLQEVIEDVTGRSLDQFFDQWVYHGGVPELTATFAWDGAAKLARVTIKQTQKVDEKVPLFRLPLPVRFLLPDGDGKSITRDFLVTVSKAEEDFYFPLPAQPQLVRLDPELTVLAKWSFTPPADMLPRLLKADIHGRLQAVEILAGRKDDAAVAELQGVIAGDPHHAVQSEAVEALGKIASDAARRALIAAVPHTDERVRKAAVTALAAIYHPECREALVQRAAVEKNPVLLSSIVGAFGTWPQHDVLPYLKTASYQNMVAAEVIQTLRHQNRRDALVAIVTEIKQNAARFTARDLGAALEAAGVLGRESNEESLQPWLAGWLNDPRIVVRAGAARALGQLRDLRSLPVLRALSQQRKDRVTEAATDAITKIQASSDPSAQASEAWKKVEEFQRRTEELEKKLDRLEKKDSPAK